MAAIDAALTEDPAARGAAADAHLFRMSWDRTCAAMEDLMRAALPTGAVA